MSTNQNSTPSARKTYDELMTEIADGTLINPEPTSKGRGGRRSKADREALAENSITYRPDAAKERRGNPDGIIWSQLRLSVKKAASEGDKAQQREVLDMITHDGWDLSRVEEHWEIGSAWKEGKYRPVIDEMLQAMKDGKVAAIYAYEVSRITRDPHVAKIIQQYAQMYNVPIRFVKTPNCHPEKNDGINEITYVVYVQQAKEESESTSARTKRNHLFRALTGRKRGGSEPMGMKTIWVEPTVSGELIDVEYGKPGAWPIFTRKDDVRADYPAEYPTEAAVVELMFAMAAQDESSPAIARRLNELGVPTFGAKHWTHQSVKAVLNNPVYAGLGSYKGKIALDEHKRYTRPHRGFIAEETWLNVQLLLEARKVGPRGIQQIYRLAGTLRCDVCGEKMVGGASYTLKNGRHQKALYNCPTGTDNPQICRNNTITVEAIEEAMLEVICSLLDNPGQLPKASIGNNDLLADIEAQLQDLGVRIAKMRSKVEEAHDEDDREAFSDKLNSLTEQQTKMALRRELATNDSAPDSFTSAELREAWNGENRIKVQRMVRNVFAAIRIKKTTPETRMNNYQLAKAGWPVNLHRVDVEFHNGARVNLAVELGAILALESQVEGALVSA
jgi:DNA invertase Pin-like site-specific DNA recombinase